MLFDKVGESSRSTLREGSKDGDGETFSVKDNGDNDGNPDAD